jgi:hypothetical protein
MMVVIGFEVPPLQGLPGHGVDHSFDNNQGGIL